MRFYGMSYGEVLDLPIKTFWLLFRMSSRIRSEEHAELLDTFAASHGGEAYKKTRDALLKGMGEVFVEAPRHSRKRLEKFRGKAVRV